MAEKTKVTRITASDDAPKKSTKAAAKTTKRTKAVKATKVSTAKAQTESTTKTKNIFVIIGRYFKGAWIELRQVRWPNRKATWALTVAVILFSVFFMVLISLLDIFFKWIFELIIA